MCSPCLLSVCQLTIHEGFGWVCPPGRRPLLIRPDGGVIECYLKDGVPQVDFTLEQCQPKNANQLPKWLRVTPPTGGRSGKVLMQLTLGKRISHETGSCHPCLPTDPGTMTQEDGWETGSETSCHDDRRSGVTPALRPVRASSNSGITPALELVTSSGVTPALGRCPVPNLAPVSSLR